MTGWKKRKIEDAQHIHSCSYFCDRPECIKAQRDELRDRLANVATSDTSPERVDEIQKQRHEHEYDWKDLYEKEKRRSAMWIAKYEELAGPAPKAIPMKQRHEQVPSIIQMLGHCPECGAKAHHFTSPPQRKPLTDEWVPVTEKLLNEQLPWLYQPMWIAMKGGVVVQGYYEWRQGRNPDRFITDLGDEWVFNADFVMPITKPTPPAIEAAHGIKENT